MNDKNWFLKMLHNQKMLQRIKNLELLIFDVDGTLSDAKVYFSLHGEDGRSFCVQDGFAMKKAIEAGLTICLMSGKKNKTTLLRGLQLSIPEDLCIDGVPHKPKIVKELAEHYHLSYNQIAIFGDDFLDAQVKIELPEIMFIAPANTPFYLTPLADLCLPRTGGQSATRMILDLILYVQEKHFAQELIKSQLQQ